MSFTQTVVRLLTPLFAAVSGAVASGIGTVVGLNSSQIETLTIAAATAGLAAAVQYFDHEAKNSRLVAALTHDATQLSAAVNNAAPGTTAAVEAAVESDAAAVVDKAAAAINKK